MCIRAGMVRVGESVGGRENPSVARFWAAFSSERGMCSPTIVGAERIWTGAYMGVGSFCHGCRLYRSSLYWVRGQVGTVVWLFASPVLCG